MREKGFEERRGCGFGIGTKWCVDCCGVMSTSFYMFSP